MLGEAVWQQGLPPSSLIRGRVLHRGAVGRRMAVEETRTLEDQLEFERGRLDALTFAVGRIIVSSIETTPRFPQGLRERAVHEFESREPRPSDSEWVRGYSALQARLAKQLLDAADLYEEIFQNANRS